MEGRSVILPSMFDPENREDIAAANAADRLITEIGLLARSFERHLKNEANLFARQFGEVNLDDIYFLAPYIIAGMVEGLGGPHFHVIPVEELDDEGDLCDGCRKELYDDIDRGLRDLLGGSGAEGA